MKWRQHIVKWRLLLNRKALVKTIEIIRRLAPLVSYRLRLARKENSDLLRFGTF
jgi:hypothetical protein